MRAAVGLLSASDIVAAIGIAPAAPVVGPDPGASRYISLEGRDRPPAEERGGERVRVDYYVGTSCQTFALAFLFVKLESFG